MNLTIVTAIVSATVASLGCFAGFVTWYANTEKRKYGLERDFEHLKRNQANIQQGLDSLFREIDRRFDLIDRDVLEIKAELRLPHTNLKQ